MTNPFDDEAGTYLVLADARGRRSLWPASIAVPGGWSPVHGPAGRAECLDHIEAHWPDAGSVTIPAPRRGESRPEGRRPR
jgi:MbtH protein